MYNNMNGYGEPKCDKINEQALEDCLKDSFDVLNQAFKLYK